MDLDGCGDVFLSFVEGKVIDWKMLIDLYGDFVLIVGIIFWFLKGFLLVFSYWESLDLIYKLLFFVEIEEIGMLVFDIDGMSLYIFY